MPSKLNIHQAGNCTAKNIYWNIYSICDNIIYIFFICSWDLLIVIIHWGCCQCDCFTLLSSHPKKNAKMYLLGFTKLSQYKSQFSTRKHLMAKIKIDTKSPCRFFLILKEEVQPLILGHLPVLSDVTAPLIHALSPWATCRPPDIWISIGFFLSTWLIPKALIGFNSELIFSIFLIYLLANQAATALALPWSIGLLK